MLITKPRWEQDFKFKAILYNLKQLSSTLRKKGKRATFLDAIFKKDCILIAQQMHQQAKHALDMAM